MKIAAAPQSTAAKSRIPRILRPRFAAARYGWSVVGLPVVLVVMVATFALLSDPFFTVSNFENVGRNLGPIALLALGEAYVILLAQIDISVGAILALSMVTTVYAVDAFGPIGFFAAPLTGAAVGLVNGTICARFLVHSVIVTIGTATAVRGLAFLITNGTPVSTDFPTWFVWFGTGQVWIFPSALIIAASAYAASIVLIRYTRYGPALYATGGNEEAARLAGLNVFWIKVSAFMICGMLAGTASLIYTSRINSGQPNFGAGLELDAIAAAVVGGMALVGGKGTFAGVAMGVAVIVILRNGLDILNVGDYWKQFVIGIVILLAVIFDRLRERGARTDFAEDRVAMASRRE